MEQRRSNLLNWVLFFLLAFLIMQGWGALMNHFFPPPKQPEAPAALVNPWEDLSPDAQRRAIGRLALSMAPNGSGIADAYEVAAGGALADYFANHPGPKPPSVHAVTKGPTVKRQDGIVMGGENFPMTVRFTNHGAAVQELILNHFDEANEMGLRVQGEKLHLIPNDPEHGSELLYHYPSPDAESPVATLAELNWQVASITAKDGKSTYVSSAEDGTESISFSTTIPDMPVKVTKTFTLKPGDYHLGLALRFERTDGRTQPLKLRYQLAGAHGLPIEGVWYTRTYRNVLIGAKKNGTVSRNFQDSAGIAYKAGGDEITAQNGSWIEYGAVVNQFFASAIVVNNHQPQGVDRTSLIAWARPTMEPDMMPLGGKIYPEKQFLQDVTVRMISQPVELRPGQPVEHDYVLYNGPVKVRLLKDLEPNATPTIDWYEHELNLDTFTDVPSPATPGWISTIGWSALLVWTTNRMHDVLWYLYHVIPNYGVCVILMTLLVRICIYPLSRRQSVAAAKMQAKMKELQPEIKKIEEKYRDNPQELQKAKTEFMLKKGVHPLAMMGSCWVMFLQMPIFLGLYYSLQESIHFRLAGFLWMPNLAAPDMLLWWTTKIPYVSEWSAMRSSWVYLGPYLNLLPLLAVIIMMVQQQLMAPPATDDQTAQQQKMMKYMSIFIGFMFYQIASGVALYYIVSSAWGVLERKLLPKKVLEPAVASVAGKPLSPSAARKARQQKAKQQEDGKFQKVRDFWQKVLKEAKKK